MYKLKLDLPNVGRGTEVEIDGLGFFKNGSEHIVSDDLAEGFRIHHMTQESTHDKKGNLVVETVLGPTLLEAMRGREGVTVETYEPPSEKAASTQEKRSETQQQKKTAENRSQEGGE